MPPGEAVKSIPCAFVQTLSAGIFTLALKYLPDCLTGAIPVLLIVLELDKVTVSASLSLVLIITFDVASTIGLTLVMFALDPGNNSVSFVSSSASKFFPENIAALKFSLIAPKYNCP